MRSRSVERATSPNNGVRALTLGVCAAVALLAVGFCGCRSREVWHETAGDDTAQIDHISRRIDYPTAEIHPAAYAEAPVTIRHEADLDAIQYRDSTLDEILQIALHNSEVLRELGGTILRNPASIRSRFTNSLAVTNPRFSPEAALSAFDAQLGASAFFNNNRQLANNPFFSGGANPFIQDLHEYTVELSKNTATGSTLALRSVSTFDGNNAPSNTFPNAWQTYLEGEIRKPMLQGGGLQFNRIAGPGSSVGVYNGVLIAKVNSDMSQTDFEVAVRNYVNDVTNAYWDLYFAYRDLDARSQAMKRALESWNRISAREKSDIETGASEALAREQYYRFKAAVDEAISGRVTQGTRTGNGSTGGTLEAAGGVQTTERRLRLLIGIKITDGELIRPKDEPTEADIIFDWYNVQQDALMLRSELRRQQMLIRKREMELLAARNFLNPRLDAVARYRFRGFGNDLINTDGINGGTAPASALGNLANGDFQEWLLGFEYEVPLGYRKGYLAVQNAELQLARERIIQREQQREIVHNLSNTIADAARAYKACQNSLNRFWAARELLDAYDAQDANDMDVDVDHLLDAQRRVVEAEIRYYRSRAEYAVALKNVHLEKGSLLSYHNLHIFDHQPHTSVSTTEELPPTEEPGTDDGDAGRQDVAPAEANETEPASLN
ncbi:MAG TPA: TolC family protein [Planctomycetes bacterium]|nr:TolC family protein [Fuerstiella sp.]HIK96004.1 TolC family protein [Planctomycetota bacterium]